MSLFSKYVILGVSFFALCCHTDGIEATNSGKTHHETASGKKPEKNKKLRAHKQKKQTPSKGAQYEEVLDEMFSIGSYDSVVRDMRKGNVRKALQKSLAAEVIDITNDIKIDEPAPAYNKLVPIIGWDRYSGDSANSLKGWYRWWKYLRMKEPIVMNWIGNLLLRIYPGNEVFRALFINGIYDPNLVVIINTLLSKGGVFIDVGSNIGYFSLLASQTVGSDGHIYAIEPSQRDFHRLVDNVSINRLSKIISCYRFAISDTSGMTRLSIACEERSALNTLGTEFSFKGIEKVQVEDVEMISIDQFAENENIKHVDVIKLDIEGSELKALHGAKNTIEKHRPAILVGTNRVALNASGTNLKELQEMLSNLRYRVYKIVFEPTFSLEMMEDLSKAQTNVVLCLHESMVPPALPKSKKKTVTESIGDFFTK